MSQRLLTPRKLLVVYVTAVVLSLVYILSNRTSSCVSSDGFDVADLDARNRGLKDYESQLLHWDSGLRLAEQDMMRIYAKYGISGRLFMARYVDFEFAHLPIIFVITPTYTRYTQKADLTRMANTLTRVRRVHWVLIEDSETKTLLVADLLRFSGLPYTHLNVVTPAEIQRPADKPRWYRPRGVLQRNAGIAWLRTNAHEGVAYFADDDNTYDVRLFEEMRKTRGVSVWPVGLVGHLRYERPIVSSEGRVTGWFTYWKPSRPFATDMAGFAVNVELFLKNPRAEFSVASRRGEMESDLLVQLIRMSDLEPRARNCTEVLVWHTRTEPANVTNEEKLRRKGLPASDLSIEV